MRKFWHGYWNDFIVSGLAVCLVLSYFWGLFHFDYMIPSGEDSLHHMTIGYDIINTGHIQDPEFRSLYYNEVIYPPVFHIGMASLAMMTGLDVVTLAQFFMRFFVVVIIFNVYFFSNRLFNSKRSIAVAAVLVLALFCPQPRQIYYEGSYLNLAVANFYLPFAVVFIGLDAL